MTWTIKAISGTQTNQNSFVGGKPKMPDAKIPSCRLCGASETFFFQVAFPVNAQWSGRTLAVFSCTKCADENYLIPEMLENGLSRADIPSGFLNSYQKNFSFLVFPTERAVLIEDYREVIQFNELELSPGYALGSFGKIGGAPDWILEDESPATYAGNTSMEFLMQVAPAYQFKTVASAEPQIELDIVGEPSPSPLDYYQLFLGNALYIFGATSGDPLVYAITQA